MRCGYKAEHRSNEKYFCKGDEKKTCKFNMLTHDKDKRFMLYDTDQKHFLVLMRNLTSKDSGMYQCLVKLKTDDFLNRIFNLEVKEGKN